MLRQKFASQHEQLTVMRTDGGNQWRTSKESTNSVLLVQYKVLKVRDLCEFRKCLAAVSIDTFRLCECRDKDDLRRMIVATNSNTYYMNSRSKEGFS